MPQWTKEQKSAIELSGNNIIVSAGAGSGKTAVLSERVIYKLHSGIHIDELLILTFTRAAAEEMKDRIRKKIKKDPTLKEELDRLESAYITTFDSFALSVVKKYHYLLDLPKDIGIAEETVVTLKKKEILDNVFDNLYESNDIEFESFIKRYSLKNDDTIKKAIAELADKIENYDVDEYLDYLENIFYTDKHIQDIIEEFNLYCKRKKQALALELHNAYHYFDDDYNSKLDEVLLPIINSSSLKELAGYKTVKLPTLKRGTSDEAKSAKELVKVALVEVLDLINYGDEQAIKNDILSTKKVTSTVVKILRSYYHLLSEYKKKEAIYTFSDIANIAKKIITDFDSARLELKNKFKEIMIDEYQDTNNIQESFIALIANSNVYMVGDIKQSIYRFRGSNPSIFKEKYDKYSKDIDGKKIDLIKNFRSRKEVLENINRIFELIMDDNLGGASYRESHEMVYGNNAYDEQFFQGFNYDLDVYEYIESDEFSNTEIEIFAIIQDIKKKREENFQVFDKDTGVMRPFKYSDAVIILDRSKYFDLYKKIFEYVGIPLTILRDEKLSDSVDLLLIKNLINLLIYIKTNNYSSDFKYVFLSIGRSFLFEYTDEYLFDIITENKYKDTLLYQCISSIDNYNSKSIRELLDDILNKTDFLNKLYKVGDYTSSLLRIEKLYEISSNLGSVGYNIEDFRDYLNSIVEEGLEIKYTSFHGDNDSVKILTIHKSKGLEYPICYFADLIHNFNTRELKNQFIADIKYGLISAIEVEDEQDRDSILKLLYKSNFIKEEISEKIRLFYVALTRAREKLVIFLPKKDTNKLEKNEFGTIEETRRLKIKRLADFIYDIRDYLPQYFKNLNTKELGLTKEYEFIKSPVNTIEEKSNYEFEVEELDIKEEILNEKVFSKSTIELITKEEKASMKFGTKVHEILEYIDFKNFDPNEIEDKFIADKIAKFLDNPLLKDVAKANIYKEYEFLYEIDNVEYHGIIDLMLEYDDHIDIIDYKLRNTMDEHYKEQLNGYKRYIQSVTNKRIETYLYSIIDELFRKVE